MNVSNFPEGKRPKAIDVSPWFGVYSMTMNGPYDQIILPDGIRNRETHFSCEKVVDDLRFRFIRRL